MPRLIDADTAQKIADKELTVEEAGAVQYVLSHTPTIEAEPVRQGRWVPVHEHMWRKRENGTIDECAWYTKFHKGPVCELCGSRQCVRCNPNWKKSVCDKVSYKCSECGDHEAEQSDYCPNCEAKMDGGASDEG